VHFQNLWQITSGGENAEGYFNFAGDRLCLQRRADRSTCDAIFVTEPDGELRQISSGRGVTTCSYFLPGDRTVLFSSTQGESQVCPPPPDYSQGYVWRILPEYDIWLHDLHDGSEQAWITGPGYDAEATVSPRGDALVFTSTRSGDLELWTADIHGKNLRQLTDEVGYDGGAFFSHDGSRIVFRSTRFSEADREAEVGEYRRLLASGLVRPSRMEIMLIQADGTGRRALTDLGGANFAPSFFPDDRRVIFASNHHAEGPRNFDLFAVNVDGESQLERITTYEGFDSFPLFSGDGRYLVFASNRGGAAEGETNLFVARWR
jgi:Tol biopolymer transport system component